MKPLRWSDLRWMNKSPAHFRYYRDNPLSPTAAMRTGSLAHKMLLGGEHEFALWEGKVRRGKAFDLFAADNEGKEILIRSEWDAARAVVDAVKDSPEAMKVLDDGDHEQRIDWTVSGRACHGTPDVLGSGLTELKITNDADPRWFPHHAVKFLWHAQLAWYEAGAIRAGLLDDGGADRISIVAVESKPPHPVVVYDLTEDAIEAGRKVWRSLFERLQVCEDNNHWPAYTDSIAMLDVPDDVQTIIIDGEEIEL